ncbi:hypothetical protein BurJ1DRAFT_1905 [Burkholderiales bacterium JOSHI_001]|nr:hypothetical protein BurJ1DRAFT_1905 [Burkholderiales bacterium JOSHI_001]
MPATKMPKATTALIPKKTPEADLGKSASALIDARIAELGDWRGQLLGRLRSLIRAANAEVIEEWKWNVPVWSCSGIICTGETYKKAVKLTFPKGASLADPSKVFNSSLEGNARRAIDFVEGGLINEAALTSLVNEAITKNKAAKAGKAKSAA